MTELKRGAPCPEPVMGVNGEEGVCGRPILCKGMCGAHRGRMRRAEKNRTEADMLRPVRDGSIESHKISSFRVREIYYEEIVDEARRQKVAEYQILQHVIEEWGRQRRKARGLDGDADRKTT